MPRMRNLDNSEGHEGWTQTQGVCEHAQVHYPRKRRENWPFKFYEEDGRMYQNVVPRRRKSDLDDVEDALW